MHLRSSNARVVLFGLFVGSLGCGPALEELPDAMGSTSAAGDTSTGGADPSTTTTMGVPPNPTAPMPGTAGVTTSDDDGSDSSGIGSSFITDPDGGVCGAVLPDGVLAHCSWCDPAEQDCARGEACKPWANDGSDTWNSTRCGPVERDPGQVGDACVVEGSAASGIDSCGAGTMCWNVDPKTLEGTCASFCGGFGNEPLCAEGELCVTANDGVLPLCLPSCDPLASQCGEGFGCYPSQNGFVCIREGDAVNIEGFVHPECPAGTFMAPTELIEGCVEGELCCSAFCDVTDPESCGVDAECLPYFKSPRPEPYQPGYCSVAI